MNYVYYVLLCSTVLLNRVHATFIVLIGAGIWYQMNPVPDLHDTRMRNRHQKIESIYGAGFWIVCHGYYT